MPTFEEKQAAREDRVKARADRAAAKAREKALAQLKIKPMPPKAYKAALERHGISIVGAASCWGVSRRQAQRFAGEGPVPRLVAKVLQLLDTGKLKKEDLL